MRRSTVSLALVLAATVLVGCGSDDEEAAPSGGSGGSDVDASDASDAADADQASDAGDADAPVWATSEDIDPYRRPPFSCAYRCPYKNCAETTTPYACPSMAAWTTLPHLETCGVWDGTYPTPTTGACTATAPTGDALARPGVDPSDATRRVLPDGRVSRPAGAEWVFADDMRGGYTVSLAQVPGTPWVVSVDLGSDDHAVRVLDPSRIGQAGPSPVLGFVKFSPPAYLNQGVAVLPSGRVYVAGYGKVQALSIDLATGALTRDDAASLSLSLAPGATEYLSGVAASPDGKRLVVTSADHSVARVFDVDPASASYMSVLGSVDLGAKESFGVYFDPADAAGTHAYVALWEGQRIADVDLSDVAHPTVARSFATDRNPQGVAFVGTRWMLVGNDFGESLTVVDRLAGTATAVPIELEQGLKGLDPSSLAYDAARSRLWVTLAGVNAVAAYDVDASTSPPTITAAGKLEAGWWPTALSVAADGSLTVANLRGHGIGPYDVASAAGEGGGSKQMRGAVERIAAPSQADLQAGDAVVRADVAVGGYAGAPQVECGGKPADFPVPATNTEGKSKVIEHVIFVVRENKTFDALEGDLAGVEGDPGLTMKASSADMDKVWGNFRDLVRSFATNDNFYNLAVKSTQGHFWTTYGRATDFCERTWGLDARPVPLCGVGAVGRPSEGSLFDWLQTNQVDYDLLGEVVGTPLTTPPGKAPIDGRYPGGPFQNITYNDLEKSCYAAVRARLECNLGNFVYMTLPNDHTVGVSPSNPSPETMVTINDEATGMLVDAISHSPIWKSTLIIITEDDPQDGGDHVDYHRAPIAFVSPWIKRGYVSKTHTDVSSLHKIFAHVLGLPYPNLVVKNAALPFDLFTSTPDYTPYTYSTHKWPIECGAGATRAEARLTDSWDFTNVDEQPGLEAQVRRAMRGAQLRELPRDLARQVEARRAAKAAGVAGRDLDD